MKLLPPRRPTTSQASLAGSAGGSCLLVCLRYRASCSAVIGKAKRAGQEGNPRLPRLLVAEPQGRKGLGRRRPRGCRSRASLGSLLHGARVGYVDRWFRFRVVTMVGNVLLDCGREGLGPRVRGRSGRANCVGCSIGGCTGRCRFERRDHAGRKRTGVPGARIRLL